MIYISVMIGVIVIAAVLTPFFAGPGGALAASSSINSMIELGGLKEAIIQRYMDDEKAFHDGSLGGVAWEKRKQFLINRYIDAARRHDFLEHIERGEGA